jgi:hypothetical protein
LKNATAKAQRVYGLPGYTLVHVRARLRRQINALLTVANNTEHPRQVQVDQLCEQLAAIDDWRAYRGGHWRIELPPGWAPEGATAVVNLLSNIANGDHHLRRCNTCRRWMLVKYAHHVTCKRAGCRTTKNTIQKRDARAYHNRHNPKSPR